MWCDKKTVVNLIIDHEAREIMYLVAVCLSVRPFVRPSVNRSHYQSKVCVCVSVIRGAYADNNVDAVDRLLISSKVS